MAVRVLVVLLVLALSYVKSDTITVSAVIRDFWPCPIAGSGGASNASLASCGANTGNAALCNCVYNFESPWANSGDDKGMMAKYLGSDNKPVWNYGNHQTVVDNSTLQYWYSQSKYSMAFPINITLSNKVCNGPCNGFTYGFVNTSFFPIDNMGFGNYPGQSHNFHFTMELHTLFTYNGSEIFTFTGDDDIWVYINKVLAIDLGGVHSAESQTIQLNQSESTLGITPGGTYQLDIFYNERHTSASDITIFTSIVILCPFRDFCGICGGDGTTCCNYTAINDNNDCTTDTCDRTTGAAVHTPVTCPANPNKCNAYTCYTKGGCKLAAVPTDDNNACTNDSCTNANGVQHLPISCDDNNACTTDSCDTVNGCQHVGVNCSDNNVCTTDTCDTTLGCQHTPIQVQDGNQCYTRTCDPINGIQATPVNCNDNNACTMDSCVNKTGCAYAKVNCDDSNACTTDSCDTVNGCQHVNVNCDDGKGLCTTKTCSKASGCQFATVNCDDNNACTTDSCDPVKGCQYVNISCDDGNFCTTDTCDAQKGCQHATVSCDDSNACTTDTCNTQAAGFDGVTGCAHSNVSCDDGIACTVDTCNTQTGCSSVALVCDDGKDCTSDSCNAQTGKCQFIEVGSCACEASKCPTTTNFCQPAHCQPTTGACYNTTVNCDDGNACTDDSCAPASGNCSHTVHQCPTTTNFCNPYSCDPMNGCTQTPVDCDDGNACTIDVPVSNSTTQTCTCEHNLIVCPGNSPCTPQTCHVDGQCYFDGNFTCDDGNACTMDSCSNNADGSHTCNNVAPGCPNSTACVPQTCDTATGYCNNVNPGKPCDDGNSCTKDDCDNNNNGACSHTPIPCEIDNYCTPVKCVNEEGCVPDTPVNCDDGNPCTNDAAVNDMANQECHCTHTAVSCNNTDLCNPQSCNATTGNCDVSHVNCDDGSLCTDDSCDSTTGQCNYVAHDCDDNDACTFDSCDPAQGCLYATVNCDDNNKCTDDFCNPASGCEHSPVNLTTSTCMTAFCDQYQGISVQNTTCEPASLCHCDAVISKCVCASAILGDVKQAAKIGGGIIAAIVIGIVVFAVIAAIGGKKGYDFYKASKDPAAKCEDNPLYEGNNHNFHNAIYEPSKV